MDSLLVSPRFDSWQHIYEKKKQKKKQKKKNTTTNEMLHTIQFHSLHMYF